MIDQDNIEHYITLDRLGSLECPYCKDSFQVDDSKVDYSDGERINLNCPHCKGELLIIIDRPIVIDVFINKGARNEIPI